VALGSLAALGVQARRLEAAGGLYVGDDPPRLLGASGLGALRGVSQHGLWLNVDMEDLSPLAWVAPGGQQGVTATTVAREAQGPVSVAALEQSLAEGVAKVLGAEWRERSFDRRTVSVCLLRQRDGKIEALLLYRHPHRGGFWQPVTGTQERGETPLETARREIREESGLALEPIPLHYKHCFVFEGRRTRGVPRLFEETAFAARIEGDPQITLDRREHGEHRWAPLEEAIAVVPFLGLKKGLLLASKALF
jgi:lipoyl(octanoyl) transferase